MGKVVDDMSLSLVGKSTSGKGCQSIKQLADVNQKVLQELHNESYPCNIPEREKRLVAYPA